MKIFNFSRFFANNSTNASRKKAEKQRRGRSCRIEELEGREMLSTSPWAIAGGFAYDYLAGTPAPALETQPEYRLDGFNHTESLQPLGAVLENAQERDLEVYNDLIARGCLDADFTWNAEGFITRIDASNRGLAGTLDVTGLTALTSLSAYHNHLTELDVSNNTALEVLVVSYTQLTELDVTGLTNLTYLAVNSNQLTELDVSNNTTLYRLDVGWNQLTELDVTGLTNLTHLDVRFNQLAELQVSGLTALTVLWASHNQLTELDLSGLITLETLDASYNQLTELDVSNNTALEWLSVSNNQLTELDVSNNTALTLLAVAYNQLTELDVSNNTALTSLGVGNNQLTELDVSNNAALTSLDVVNNQLTELDVSNNTALEWLYAHNNQLTKLDVSNNTALTSLQVTGNQLTEMDVSNNTALTLLVVAYNQLTKLDISNNTALVSLFAWGNQLTFSTLKLPGHSIDSFYISGATMPISLDAGNRVDLSGENVDGMTEYTWHYANGDVVDPSLYTETNGRFTFAGLDVSTVIYCTMTNVGYPGLTLLTTEVTISVPALSAPKIDDVAFISSGEVIVTWSTVPNAARYVVEYATNDSFTDSLTVSAAGTWIGLQGLDIFATNYFRVMAIGNGEYGDSDWSEVVVKTFPKTQLTEPTIVYALALGSGVVTVAWTTANNADGYVIECATSDTFADANIKSVTGTWATFDELDANKTYYFRVMAIGSDEYSNSDWSSVASELTQAIRLIEPANFSALSSTTTANSVEVEWEAVAGMSYEIQYSLTGASRPAWISTFVTGTENGSATATIDTLSADTRYNFRIRAMNEVGMVSEWVSQTRNGVIVAETTRQATGSAPAKLGKPKIPKRGQMGAPTSDSITVNWSHVADATSYVITYTIPSGVKGVPGTRISETFTPDDNTISGTTLTYKIEGLKQGTSYRISIVAQSEGGMATKAVTVTARTVNITGATKLGASKAAGERTTISSITLTWKAATAATGYIIEVWAPPKTKGAVPELIRVVEPSEITGTKYQVTDLQASTKYTFRVIGITEEGTETAVVRKVLSTAKFASVSKVRSSSNDDSVVLNWQLPRKPADGAEYITYEIDWVINRTERKSVAIASSDNTTATILRSTLSDLGINLASTKKHNFVIRAVIYGEDGTTVINQSLDGRFSITPSRLM